MSAEQQAGSSNSDRESLADLLSDFEQRLTVIEEQVKKILTLGMAALPKRAFSWSPRPRDTSWRTKQHVGSFLGYKAVVTVSWTGTGIRATAMCRWAVREEGARRLLASGTTRSVGTAKGACQKVLTGLLDDSVS